MLTITTKPGCELLLVPVVKEAYHFYIDDHNCELGYWIDDDPVGNSLPPGSWEFIGTTETMTEERAAEIVHDIWGDIPGPLQGYFNYMEAEYCSPFTALESLRSCIQAAGGEPDTVYAILKKNV